MKHVYLWIPAILTLGFWRYYTTWDGNAAERANEKRRALIAAGADPFYVDRDGKKEAEADIAAGHPKLKICGTPYHTHEFGDVIYERFGVTLEVIAGCIVSRELVQFADDYNRTMEAHIIKKYGRYALDDAHAEAMRRMIRKYGSTR